LESAYERKIEVKVRHVLSIRDIGPENLSHLVSRSLEFASGSAKSPRPLEGKVVGIYFRGTSTRTRTAFTVAALRLGGGTIHYGPNDLQLVTGESLQDTARVLAGFINVLVIRTNDSLEEMKVLAQQDEMAVVNAMSENEHPTQAIADLVTIQEALNTLEGVHILYLGEGNNSASALALAVAMMPRMRLTLVTPEGYGLSRSFLAMVNDHGQERGSFIEQHHSMKGLPRGVDVVYTTRWQTMGVPKEDLHWREKFVPYSVTPEVMGRVSKPSGTIFMHDLPAMRGSEVLDEVLDGPQSRAFRQARHKLSSAMAVLEWCVSQERLRSDTKLN
jgi:ornithine carbamoyltransferase